MNVSCRVYTIIGYERGERGPLLQRANAGAKPRHDNVCTGKKTIFISVNILKKIK